MSEQTTGRWALIRSRALDTPQRRARYERSRKQVLATRLILQQIDAERERRGLTKTALAREVGTTPSVIRRLFSSETSNPTLGTVVAVLEALDLAVEVRPAQGHRRTAAPTRPAREPERERALA